MHLLDWLLRCNDWIILDFEVHRKSFHVHRETFQVHRFFNMMHLKSLAVHILNEENPLDAPSRLVIEVQ